MAQRIVGKVTSITLPNSDVPRPTIPIPRGKITLTGTVQMGWVDFWKLYAFGVDCPPELEERPQP